MHPTPMSPRPAIEPPGAARSDELRWLGTSWGVTLPASFEPTPPPEPFMEALRGLAVREVKEPEVFRLFFDRKVRAY
jgi:hypothetical protein